jgi:hypothetical protein
MSQLKVNALVSYSGNTVTLGTSGDTINVASGVTFNASSASVNLPAVNLTTGVTGTLPVANGGTNLSSGFANGIIMADQWRLTADTNSGTNADVTTNWERVDNSGWGGIGTGLTESSGIFSFPSTGIYLILAVADMTIASADAGAAVDLNITLDNSSFSVVANCNATATSINFFNKLPFNFIFDVTNISNDKFKFSTSGFLAGTLIRGNTAFNETHFTVIRLGDT